MATEKRAERRQSLDYPCWIVVDSGDKLLARICDISKTGAKLIVDIDAAVPEEFTLNLTEDGQVHRYCRVSWRDGHNIGIVLLKSKPELKPDRREDRQTKNVSRVAPVPKSPDSSTQAEQVQVPVD